MTSLTYISYISSQSNGKELGKGYSGGKVKNCAWIFGSTSCNINGGGGNGEMPPKLKVKKAHLQSIDMVDLVIH